MGSKWFEMPDSPSTIQNNLLFDFKITISSYQKWKRSCILAFLMAKTHWLTSIHHPMHPPLPIPPIVMMSTKKVANTRLHLPVIWTKVWIYLSFLQDFSSSFLSFCFDVKHTKNYFCLCVLPHTDEFGVKFWPELMCLTRIHDFAWNSEKSTFIGISMRTGVFLSVGSGGAIRGPYGRQVAYVVWYKPGTHCVSKYCTARDSHFGFVHNLVSNWHTYLATYACCVGIGWI